MDHYSLHPNEAVLYEGKATLNDNKAESELLLTNINIVVITKTRKLFSKEQIDIKIFPIEEIKVYNDIPQVKKMNIITEIYFINDKIKLSFISRSSAYKFANKTIELITGKSISIRGAQKVKGALNLVDDTLGFKTMDTVKGALENGIKGTILGGIGKNTSVKEKEYSSDNTIKETLNITKNIFSKRPVEKAMSQPEENNQNEKYKTNSYDEQIETVKKLKDLLDADILSQEEFEAKKKQILEL